MAQVRIPYYAVRNGNGFWEPRGRMRQLGCEPKACGPDGPEAWAIAQELNRRWQQTRKADADKAIGGAGFVYFLVTGSRIKIGFSDNPFTRVGHLKIGISDGVDRLVAVRGTVQDERKLHQRLSAYRMSGEWFVAAPAVLRTMLAYVAKGTDQEDRSEFISPHSET